MPGHYCPEAELCLQIKASRTQLSALPSSVCPGRAPLPFCTSVACSAQCSTYLVGLMGGSVKHTNTLSTGLAHSKSIERGLKRRVKSVTWLGTVGENQPLELSCLAACESQFCHFLCGPKASYLASLGRTFVVYKLYHYNSYSMSSYIHKALNNAWLLSTA